MSPEAKGGNSGLIAKGVAKGVFTRWPVLFFICYTKVVHGLLAIWQMAVANRAPDVGGFTRRSALAVGWG
jgi:hypothetical protein